MLVCDGSQPGLSRFVEASTTTAFTVGPGEVEPEVIRSFGLEKLSISQLLRIDFGFGVRSTSRALLEPEDVRVVR